MWSKAERRRGERQGDINQLVPNNKIIQKKIQHPIEN